MKRAGYQWEIPSSAVLAMSHVKAIVLTAKESVKAMVIACITAVTGRIIE